MASRTMRMIEHRKILGLLVRRDLKLRYAGSFLGYVWTILEPLLMAGVYWFVFTKIFVRVGKANEPYILFLVTGLFAWNWFSGAITDACGALTAESRMVRTTNVPRELWVVRTTTSKMVEYVYTLPVIAAFTLLYRHHVSWFVLLYPVAMLIQYTLTLGLALALAPLNVISKDVIRIVKIALRMGFYLTPVLYSLSEVESRHSGFGTVFALNPMAGIMSLYRAAFWPEDAPTPILVGSSVVLSLLALAVGLFLFRRLEGQVLKEI